MKLIDSGMFVAPAYKNKRVPFTQIYGKGNASLVAAWRGVKNSARVMFIGNTSFVKFLLSQEESEKSLGVKSMYDFINWFTMASNMIKVTKFTHRVLNLSNSPCAKALHLSHVTGDHVREGNLVLVEVDAEELVKRAWRPLRPLK